MAMFYTKSQKKAIQLMNDGENIFLTGKPGTGKTELLRTFYEEKTAEGEKVLITASTGIAASNFENGRTLHSVLHFCPYKTNYDLSKCTDYLQYAKVLIVDEVSMLGDDIINHLAACLNYLDNPPQIIMSGDFFQLPPVKRGTNTTSYPFENPNWKKLNLIPCVLHEVVRQSDPEFKRNLDLARRGYPNCIGYFNTFSRTGFLFAPVMQSQSNLSLDDGYTFITRIFYPQATEFTSLIYGNVQEGDFYEFTC